jgi:hypothetical protein
MTPEVRLELQRLLSALYDDTLTDAQHARLEELLRADAACRRLYLEFTDLHARLLVHPRFAGESPVTRAIEPAATTPVGISPHSASGAELLRPRRGRRVPQAVRYALVAAATLVASILAQVSWWHLRTPVDRGGAAPPPAVAAPTPPRYVATLTRVVDCVWDDSAEARRAGARLLPGELRLRSGVAQVRFDSGADLTIEGPAELHLESDTAAAVLRGKVVFRADDSALAFDLHTPSSTLVDLGTEYAVVVGPEGEEVHVFDGEVERQTNAAPGAVPEYIMAGEARRYLPSADPGQPTPLDPARFVRRLADPELPDPAAGLLAYEGFDYRDPAALGEGRAAGGSGFIGPWTGGFARPLNEGGENRLALNVRDGLTRPGAATAGGSFDYTGFTKYFRRLATPVRMDADGVYYLSFLIRRYGPQVEPLNSVSVQMRTDEELQREWRNEGIDMRKRLNFGVDRTNDLFTHLERVGTRAPLPLSYGETYLLVAKVVASGAHPDQVFLRVYGPDEPVGRQEPVVWSSVGRQIFSDLVFDWFEVHINSKTRQTIDEVRLGTTWSSVAAPWAGAAGPAKGGRP